MADEDLASRLQKASLKPEKPATKISSNRYCQGCFGAQHNLKCLWKTSVNLSSEEFWKKFKDNEPDLRHEWNNKFAINLSIKFPPDSSSSPPPTLEQEPMCDYCVSIEWPRKNCGAKSSLKIFSMLITNTELAKHSLDIGRDNIATRIRESAVNGHSNLLWGCTPEAQDRKLDRRAQCLLREYKLLEILRNAWGEDFEGRFQVRLTQSFLNYHDLDNACVAVLGKIDVLQVLCDEHAGDAGGEKERHADAVDELIAVPLASLYEASSVLVNTMTSMLKLVSQQPQSELHDTLQRSIVHRIQRGFFRVPNEERVYDFFNPELIQAAGNDVGILIGHQYDGWRNKWQFCVGGGKRNLGETPLECAIRECNEEFSMSISSPMILDNPNNPMDDSEWLVVRHEQPTPSRLSVFILLHPQSSNEVMKVWENAAKGL